MHWKPSRWRWKTSSVGALAATAAATAAESPTQCWTVHALLQLVQKKVYILLALNSCSSTTHWCRSPFALQLSKDVFSLPNMGEEEPDVQPCTHLHLGKGFMDSAQCLSYYYYSSEIPQKRLWRGVAGLIQLTKTMMASVGLLHARRTLPLAAATQPLGLVQ